MLHSHTILTTFLFSLEPEGIDPHGYLADLTKGPYFHSEQNVVKYNNQYIDAKGMIK